MLVFQVSNQKSVHTGVFSECRSTFWDGVENFEKPDLEKIRGLTDVFWEASLEYQAQ